VANINDKHLLGIITIPLWRPTPRNRTTGPRGSYKVAADKKRVFAEAYYQMRHQKIPAAIDGEHRAILVELHRTTHHTYDPDNRDHALKSILDGLSRPKGRKTIGAGLIVDDTAAYVSASTVEFTKQPVEKTVIKIYRSDVR